MARFSKISSEERESKVSSKSALKHGLVMANAILTTIKKTASLTEEIVALIHARLIVRR
jgi:hypothetical protein